LIVSALATVLSSSTGFVAAATDAPPVAKITQTQAQEQMYGSQLMTQQERLEFREKMHTAGTVEEKEKVRREHHKAMQERAASQSITLPDEPPADIGGMMGQSGGMGGGGKGKK
jgi:hypothetical protein